MTLLNTLPYFYSGIDINKFKFYAVPQLLFESDIFSSMSMDAKVLYSIMVDKATLSQKNDERFSDEEGRVFIIYKVNDIMKDIQRGHSTVSKLLSELEGTGLIEKVRSSGVDRTNRIYVKNFSLYAKSPTDKYLYNDFDFDKYLFYMLPKELISNSEYKKISLTAKVLYMFMLERVKLSKLNAETYADENGRIFIFYSIDSIQEKLGCARATAVKALRELEDNGLVEKAKNAGLNAANKIYVLDFAAGNNVGLASENVEIPQRPNFELSNIQNLNSSTSNIYTMQHPNFELMSVQDLNPNNTYINNTKESSSIQSNKEFDDLFSAAIELEALISVDDTFIDEMVMDEINKGLPQSKYKSRFNKIKAQELSKASLIESMATSIVRFVNMAAKEVHLSGLTMKKDDLVDKLLQVNSVMFLMAYEKFVGVNKPIKNYGAYLVSILLDLLETEALHTYNVTKNL